MVMRIEGAGVRAIAREMDRDPSTISRELARNGACTVTDGGATATYDAVQADRRAKALLAAPGRHPKLAPDTALFSVVHDCLRTGWSPEQTAGMLKRALKDDPSKSSFSLTVPIASIDTNNVKRDEHLRAPDYFNDKQFPTMTFQSTKVKAVDGGFEVTGDLTMHGVTKSITFTLKGGDKIVEFPKGIQRVGVNSTLSVKRSDFGVTADLR